MGRRHQRAKILQRKQFPQMTTSPVATTNPVSELKNKIEQRQARVAIIGLGYVGLPLALLYTEQKFRVTGFDIDQRKVTTLTQGGSYIVRILPSEIQQARAQGFEATSDYARLTEMDAIIICVPTPLNEYHEPDLSYITDTAKAIAPHLRAGQLVVLESTTYPGTTEEVMVPILEKGNKHGLKAARNGPSNGQEIYVAFSPEREDPGNHHCGPPRHSESRGRSRCPGLRNGRRDVRNHLQPHRARLFARSRGDDQAAGEHLPLREYRPGQRIEAAFAAHGPGYLGSHRGGVHQAVSDFSLSTPAPAWADTAFRSILSIFPGKPRNGISAPASSNWPAKSISACRITCSIT